MVLQSLIINCSNATIDCVQTRLDLSVAGVKWKWSSAGNPKQSTTVGGPTPAKLKRPKAESSNRIIISILCQICGAQEMLPNMWSERWEGDVEGTEKVVEKNRTMDQKESIALCQDTGRQTSRKCNSKGCFEPKDLHQIQVVVAAQGTGWVLL